MAHCSAMLCPQVTLSGDAEWPKVADAVIEAEFLIASHHPLRETIMAQTGRNETERREFLNAFHTKALAALLHQWDPKETAEPLF